MNQEKRIRILILGDQSHNRLADLLTKTYEVTMCYDTVYLQANIKQTDLVLVDELKDNWHVAEVIKEAKKHSLQIPPIDRLSTEDKKHLLEVIKVRALEATNKIKVELVYKEQKIQLTEEELDKVLRVKELLNPITCTVVFPNGSKQEIKVND